MAEDRRYQVFVSSTFFDLRQERSAVVSALLQLDAFPAGMELFPATDDDSWTLIKRVIDSSDYYLLVIGGRYGSIDPSTELSYTEMEFDYTVERGKPAMAFLHGAPEKIELGKSEDTDSARAKLDAFRDKVKERKHVKFWVGADDLAGKVALSFGAFRNSYPAIGWVRGNQATSNEALAELNDLRKENASLKEARTAERRGPPPGTEDLSKGDDPAGFDLAYTVKFRTTYSAEREIRGRMSSSLSWDDFFGQIGPLMLNEAKEDTLPGQIDEYLRKSQVEPALEAATAVAEEVFAEEAAAEDEANTEEIERARSLSVRLEKADFNTLIIQLRALGLIEQSNKSRSVKDTATYWTLTPYGDQHLTTLRAIRRRPGLVERTLERITEMKENAVAGFC